MSHKSQKGRKKHLSNYELIIVFRTSQRGFLYQGPSFLKRNLSDELVIERNRIVLRFSRVIDVDVKNILTSPNSYIRFELQRALCFFLAVTGNIPRVSKFFISGKGIERPVEHEEFSDTWKNCQLSHLLDPGAVSAIFSSNPFGKIIYTALTYWLKAQLALFSGDRFRAAWSGFNALYTFCAGNEENQETRKLKAFWTKLNSQDFLLSLVFVQRLNNENIWERLDWYNYVKNLKAVDRLIQDYCDAAYIPKICSLYQRLAPSETWLNKNKQYRSQIQGHNNSNSIQLRFLVSEYCYFYRNRSFHGGKPYPVFVIAPEAESMIEDMLCELLLYVIEDAIKLLPQKL